VTAHCESNCFLLDHGRALSDDRQMDTIEDYKIIESQDLGSLAEKVNAALKEGWQPHGAPFIHVIGAAVVCCQAMVNFHQPTSAETIAKLRRAAASVFRR
jgi:hypothetical protein